MKTVKSIEAVSAGSPVIRVLLPKAEGDDSGAVPEQTETVIVNGKAHSVPRGEYTAVSPEVFTALRLRYPAL